MRWPQPAAPSRALPRAPAAPGSSSGRGRSVPRSRCCSPAAACGRRSRLAPRTRRGRSPNRVRRSTCRGVSLPPELRIETVDAGARRAPTSSSSGPLPRPGRGHRRARPRRAAAGRRSSRWPRDWYPPDGVAPRRCCSALPPERVARAWAGPRTRTRWSRGRRAGRRLGRGLALTSRVCSRARRRGLRGVQRPDRRRTRGRGQERRRARRRAPPRPGPQRRGRRRGAHLRRGPGAMPLVQRARPSRSSGWPGRATSSATALAPQRRNRRAGELLAAGVPRRSPTGSARRSRRSSRPLLARALTRAKVEAPVTARSPG